jgi:hypothetical protein
MNSLRKKGNFVLRKQRKSKKNLSYFEQIQITLSLKSLSKVQKLLELW